MMPLSCAWVGGAETSSSYLPNIRFLRTKQTFGNRQIEAPSLWHRINVFDREQEPSVRPLKISRDELLQRCAGTFRRYGYHGTTMEMLSSACGLTKASFYHHYPNKEALLRDVLEWTHQRLAETLFSIAYDPLLTPRERLEKLGRKAPGCSRTTASAA